MIGAKDGDVNMHDMCVYTVSEVAEVLKVSTKTVYNMIHDDQLFAIRVRGQIRITSYALDEYLSRGGARNETTGTRTMVP